MTWSLRTIAISIHRSSSYVARAYAAARSSSGATTLPTWWSGSPRVLRANTSYSTASPLTRWYFVTWTRSDRQPPGLEGVAPGLGHACCRPRRVPHHVHPHLAHAAFQQQPLAHVLEDE